jgi:uncharacterized OB-fold protein
VSDVVPAKPRPQPDELSRPFWEAAREGRLLIQRCPACARHQWYPRPLCVACGARDPAWAEASGRAVVHTFSVVRRTPNREFGDELPYVFAVVELEEGVRMATRLVGVESERLRCGMAVRASFPPPGDDGLVLPVFEVV